MMTKRCLNWAFLLYLFTFTLGWAQEGGPHSGPDPYEQWLQWEEQANLPYMRKDVQEVPLSSYGYLINDVEMIFNKDFPQRIKDHFVRNGKVYFPIHPAAQAQGALDEGEEVIPGLQEFRRMEDAGEGDPECPEMHGRYTSSRTLSVQKGDLVFQVKAPTNFLIPFSPSAPFKDLIFNYKKTDLTEETVFSVKRTEYIQEIDALIGKDPELEVIPELGSFRYRPTGNGFIIRDSSLLRDGHYYLPAFSIPYAGKAIAAKNGQPHFDFWDTHYAALLGKAKAKMLLRYGLQMYTPNPQNMLIQLESPTMTPTGKLIFRDLPDFRMNRNMIWHTPMGIKWLKFEDHFDKENPQDLPLNHANPFTDKHLHIYWENSAWRLDEDKNADFIPEDVLAAWEKTHANAFVEEMEKALEIRLNYQVGVRKKNQYSKCIEKQRPDKGPCTGDELDFLPVLDGYLNSPGGKERLKTYREGLVKKQRSEK